jgi:hypothetical protein
VSPQTPRVDNQQPAFMEALFSQPCPQNLSLDRNLSKLDSALTFAPYFLKIDFIITTLQQNNLYKQKFQ